VLFIVARNSRTSADYESDTIRIPPLVLKPQG
jgi:hypothetical protein